MSAAARDVGVAASTGGNWLREGGGVRPAPVDPATERRGRPRGGRMPESVRGVFWAALTRGRSMAGAAGEAGVSWETGRAWLREAGGVRPPTSNPQLESQVTAGQGQLTLTDRARIEELLAARYTPAAIAGLLGRARSTISRELQRGHTPEGRYRAVVAHDVVQRRRLRPRERKLTVGSRLYDEVVARLRHGDSPEQVAGRLRMDFPDDLEMRVSHETIYQALYVQARGGLRAEIASLTRSGRTRRKPHGRDTNHGPVKDMINISERPAEADDRAVPGHWEGDLILGAHNKSAVGTLVERSTGFVMLLHLPDDHTAPTVAAAMTDAIGRLPEHLWRSLTWDQGSEMALHTKITAQTGLPIYFCDPHSPWQRGTNENTNGLLRQYLPKGTDLSVWGPGFLDQIASQLNGRPRKRHGWLTPAEKLNQLLSTTQTDPVAGTA